MSNAALNIFVRVISKRMENGEAFEEIFESYPALTEEEKQSIRFALANENSTSK